MGGFTQVKKIGREGPNEDQGMETKKLMGWFDELSSVDNSGQIIMTTLRRGRSKPVKKMNEISSLNNTRTNGASVLLGLKIPEDEPAIQSMKNGSTTTVDKKYRFSTNKVGLKNRPRKFKKPVVPDEAIGENSIS